MTPEEKATEVARILRGECGRNGCTNKKSADHECPYNVEINDDHGLCDCCAACEQECAYDI